MQILLLVLGFVLLIKGADIFVNASVGIAERLRIPSIIIGLTIVAMGTSTPEAVISVTASLRGANALAVGNVVGSNIFNLIFIIGLCAIIKPIAVEFKQISKDFCISIFAAVMLLGLKLAGGEYIPRAGSLVFLILFLIYLGHLILLAMKAREETTAKPADTSEKKTRALSVHVMLAVFGCVLIFFGGQLTVDNAKLIAYDMGISERIIGLTVVAIGTSMPELITSLVACKRGENEFALGNIIGSNIFNIMFILGIAGIISPLDIMSDMIFDTVFLVAGSSLVLLFVYTRRQIGRVEGLAMLLSYVGYMIFVLF